MPSAIRSGQNATSTSSPSSLDEPLDQRGDARVHGAAQDEELAVAEVVGDVRRSRPARASRSGLRCSSTGVPIDDDDVLGLATEAGSVVACEQTLRRGRVEHLGGPRLDEGHSPPVDLRDGVAVDVVEHDAQAAVGEGEPEREADVAATTDDDDVPRRVHQRPHRRRRMSRPLAPLMTSMPASETRFRTGR